MTDLQAWESQIWSTYHLGGNAVSYTPTDGVERFQYFDAFIETPEEGGDDAPMKFRGEFVTEVPLTEVVNGAAVYNWVQWVNRAGENVMVACAGTYVDAANGVGSTRVLNYKGATAMNDAAAAAWDTSSLDAIWSTQYRAAREKQIDKTGTFEEFVDNVTTVIDPNTGEEVSTIAADPNDPQQTTVEVRFDPNTGNRTTTVKSQVPKPDGTAGTVEQVLVTVEDTEKDTLESRMTIDGKPTMETVASLSNPDDVYSYATAEYNADGTSVKTAFDMKTGMMTVTTYDANGAVTNTTETSMGGRRLNADDFVYDSTWSYTETPLDYGTAFFQKSRDRPFFWFDVTAETALTFCSFELTEKTSTVEKVVRDLNGANRAAWDGASETKPFMIFPGGAYTEGIDHGARYFSDAAAGASTAMQWTAATANVAINLPDLGHDVGGDVYNATETAYQTMFDTAATASGTTDDGTQEITTLWDYGLFNMTAAGNEADYEFDAAFFYVPNEPATPEDPVTFNLGIVFTTAIAPESTATIVDMYQYALMEKLDENGEPTNRTMAVSCRVTDATQAATVTGINGTAAQAANVTEYSPQLETDYGIDPSQTRWMSVKEAMPVHYEKGAYDWNNFNYQKCAAMRQLSAFDKLDGTWTIWAGTYIVTTEATHVISAEVYDFVDIRSPRKEPIKVDYQYQGSVKPSPEAGASWTPSGGSAVTIDNVEMNLDLLYIVPNDTETENTMVLSLNTKITQSAIADLVKPRMEQFVQYRKKGEFGPYRIVACVNGATNGDPSTKPTIIVRNFHTTDAKRLMDPAGIVQNMEYGIDQNVLAPMDPSYPEFFLNGEVFSWDEGAVAFNRNPSDGLYGITPDATNTLFNVPCIAELPFSKFDDGTTAVGKEFFGDYDVRLGFHLREANDQTYKFKWLAPQDETLAFKSPQYDDSISSVVETLADNQRMEFMAPQTYTGDSSEVFGQAANFYPNPTNFTFNAFGLSVKDNSTAPLIRLEFKVELDPTLAANGDKVVYWLKAANMDIYTDDLILQCIATVTDTKAEMKIGEYLQDYDPSATTNRLGATMEEKQVAAKEMIVSRSKNDALYKTRRDPQSWSNTCVIDIEVTERTAEKLSDVLDWYYSMSVGIMYYKAVADTDMTAVTPVALFPLNFEAYLPSPVYSEDLAIETSDSFFSWGEDMSAWANTLLMTSDAIAYRTVDLSWETAVEIDKPDLLKIDFTAELPNVLNDQYDSLAFYFRYKADWVRTADQWDTAVCIANKDQSTGAAHTYSGVFDYSTVSSGSTLSPVTATEITDLATPKFVLNSTSWGDS